MSDIDPSKATGEFKAFMQRGEEEAATGSQASAAQIALMVIGGIIVVGVILTLILLM